MTEFFAMGGYAFYIWTTYGLFFFLVLANILLPHFRLKQTLASIARKQRREQILNKPNTTLTP